jgi:hypothetical protein
MGHFALRPEVHMMRLRPCLAFLIACSSSLSAQNAPWVHELKASARTVHRGFFDASLKPVLTIDSGDLVRLETATGNPRYFERPEYRKRRFPRSCMTSTQVSKRADEGITR